MFAIILRIGGSNRKEAIISVGNKAK